MWDYGQQNNQHYSALNDLQPLKHKQQAQCGSYSILHQSTLFMSSVTVLTIDNFSAILQLSFKHNYSYF